MMIVYEIRVKWYAGGESRFYSKDFHGAFELAKAFFYSPDVRTCNIKTVRGRGEWVVK